MADHKSQERRLKWAIVGASRFAQEVIGPAIIRTGGSVGAVWSRTPSSAARLANATSATVCASLEVITDDQSIDVAYVSATPVSHPALVAPLLEAGIPVLCEKPLGDTVEASERIAALSAYSDTPCYINHHLRANSCVRALRQALRQGDLGETTEVIITNFQTLPMPPAWRLEDPASGGVVRDLTVHDLDLVRHLWGPATLRTCHEVSGSGAVATEVAVSLETHHGTAVYLHDGWTFQPGQDTHTSLVVTGTQGFAMLSPAVTSHGSRLVLRSPADLHEVVQDIDAYEQTITFVAEALEGHETPLATAAEAARTQLLVDEIAARINHARNTVR